MLFNSYQFLFLFLPITLILFYFFSLFNNKKLVILTIFISSLIFYGAHNVIYLALFIFSIIVNYYFGWRLSKPSQSNFQVKNTTFLKIGIVFNILLLFIFKYFNFFIDNLNNYGFNIQQFNILLPIGISFYTFQQIGFLVDIYKKDSKICHFFEYASFVSFFPQLIAGPIVHHADFIKQIKSHEYKPNDKHYISLGIAIFIIGLFKKIIIADTLSLRLVKPFYEFISQGNVASTLTSWIGTFSYSMQIYFDFSAYSEMAIGLGLLFGITLPINFDSPFQSKSLIDYWSRWNITLSNFISNYIYLPIFKKLCYGSSSFFRNHISAIIFSMTISGFWHGANWNFILWGIIHGFALAINHLFKAKKIYKDMPLFLKRTMLVLFINTSFVFFKVSDISLIKSILISMFPIKNIINFKIIDIFALQINISLVYYLIFLFLAVVVLFSPSTLKILGYYSINNKINIKNSIFRKYNFSKLQIFNFSIILTLCFITCIVFIHRQNEFIYFQF